TRGRRNGRSLPGPAQRSRESCGDQGSPGRLAVSCPARTLSERTANTGSTQPSLDRTTLRRRYAGRGNSLVCDGIRGGRAADAILPPPCLLRGAVSEVV